MAYPEAGTHIATIGDRSLYESEGGALMCCLDCIVNEQTSITAYVTIANKDGALNENGLKTMHEALGWPRGDLESLWAHLESMPRDHQVSIDVGTEWSDKLQKEMPRVKWVNALNGGGNGVKAWGDRKALLAKYNNKFRAVFGGTPAKPTPKAVATPPATPPKPAAPPPPPAANVAPSDMMAVWQRVCECYGEKATEAWGVLQDRAGKPQEQITPLEWGAMLARMNEKFPPQAAQQAEEDLTY